MAAIPPIPQLPPAPSRSQGQAAFNLTADPFIAALPPMVANINSRLVSIGESVTAAEGYRTAAAGSATAAAESAGAANFAKDAAQKAVIDTGAAGAAQVNLAAQQAALAKSQADSAAASAAAAGAAAGLPSDRKPFDVLQIDSTGKVVFASAEKIGEVVITSDVLDSTYVLADGVYLQSAFPLLFQKIGKIPTPGVYSFQGVDNPSGYTVTDIYSDGNGVWIAAVSDVTGTSTNLLGYVLRSTDTGKTWTPISISRLRNSRVRYANGIWVCVGRGWDTTDTYKHFSYSQDGGLTWSIARRITSGTSSDSAPLAFLDVNSSGEIILCAYFSSSQSQPSPWTSKFIPANLSQNAEWSGYSFIGASIFQSATQQALGIVCVPGFALVYGVGGKLARITITATATSGGAAIASKTSNDLKAGAVKNGTILIVGSAGAVIRSTDAGATFLNSAVGGTPDFISAEGVGGGVWLLGTTAGAVWISTDDGFTFTKNTPSGVNTALTSIRSDSGTVVAASNAVLRRSESLYSYDANTQFLVPAVIPAGAFKAYVKAKV